MKNFGTTPLGASIELVENQTDLLDMVENVKYWPMVGLDTETALLTPMTYDDKGKVVKDRLDFKNMALRAVQFGNEDTVYVVDCALVKDLNPIRPILEGTQIKIAHFQKFEYKILKAFGFDTQNMACTMRAEQVLKQGLLMKAPSLAELTEKYLDLTLDKDVRDTFVEEREVKPLSEEQIRYSAMDVDILLPIFKNQENQLRSEILPNGKTLWDIARFEWKVQRAFCNIELRGFKLDQELWRERIADAERRREEALIELRSLFRPAAVKRWEKLLEKNPEWLKKRPDKDGVTRARKDKIWNFDNVLTSPKQLLEAFKELNVFLKDTNERTLKFALRTDISEEGKHAIDLLLNYRKIEKQCSSYSETWINMISDKTGRIHAEYDELKDTARTGCSSPNIQQVPKRKEGKAYRRCFIPEDGNVFVVSDYSQIELRVAAELSGDTNMIKVFNAGEDLHKATAALMFKKPIDQIGSDQRIAAKAVNFGILFGIGPQKLSEQIVNEGGPEISKEGATRILRMYSQAYPKLMKWLTTAGETGRSDLVTYSAMGHRRRFERPVMPPRETLTVDEYKEAVDNYRGRMAGIERESKNTPIQSTAACIAKNAILKLEEILPKYHAGIVAFIHDEIVVECNEMVADQVLQIVKDVMEQEGNKFMSSVPCVAEATLGLTWLAEEGELES